MSYQLFGEPTHPPTPIWGNPDPQVLIFDGRYALVEVDGTIIHEIYPWSEAA